MRIKNECAGWMSMLLRWDLGVAGMSTGIVEDLRVLRR